MTNLYPISTGSESDATNELRKRKEIKPTESDMSAINTIPKPESEPEPEPEQSTVTRDEQINNTNDDKGIESNETVKTQTDKKNE